MKIVTYIDEIFQYFFALLELLFCFSGRANRLMFNSTLLFVVSFNMAYFKYIGEDYSLTIPILSVISVLSLIIRRLKDFKFEPEYSNTIDRIFLADSFSGWMWMFVELFFVMGVDDKDSPFRATNYNQLKAMSLCNLLLTIISLGYYMDLSNIINIL